MNIQDRITGMTKQIEAFLVHADEGWSSGELAEHLIRNQAQGEMLLIDGLVEALKAVEANAYDEQCVWCGIGVPGPGPEQREHGDRCPMLLVEPALALVEEWKGETGGDRSCSTL